MGRRTRILASTSTGVLREPGGEALVVELDRQPQLPLDKRREPAGLGGLSTVAASEGQWQADDHTLDSQLSRQRAQAAESAARSRLEHRGDRGRQEAGWVADRAATASASVIQRKHSHGP